MPTALQLSRKEWQSYRLSGRPDVRSTPSPQDSIIDGLMPRVRKLGERIRDEFGATRVILFGSLARGDDFSLDSDIDLAVEGLTATAFWQVWRLAEEYFPAHRVDVVELEQATGNLRRAIENQGVQL
jgi:predicted nucleotidyltransferase